MCDVGETLSNCPEDCSEKVIEASPTASAGAIGTMFYVEAMRDIELSSFDFYSAVVTTGEVQIYTRPGQYNGYEIDEAGWSLVYDNPSLTMNGRSTPTLLGDIGVRIRKGSSQSFFIYTPTKLMYAPGSVEGSLFSYDESVKLYEGIGLTAKFSGDNTSIVSPRVIRGVIRYDTMVIVIFCFDVLTKNIHFCFVIKIH